MSEEERQAMDELIAYYVAGNLTRPAEVLVESHLELVPDAKHWVDDLRTLGGIELEESAPVALNDPSAMLDAIFQSTSPDQGMVGEQTTIQETANYLPTVLEDFIGMKADDIPWRTKLPGVRMYSIETEDDSDVYLLNIKAGKKMPQHTHDGREMTLVLQGAFSDEDGRYAKGDVAIADSSIDHRPIADPGEDCICFIVTEGSLKLTGPIGRIVSSILPG